MDYTGTLRFQWKSHGFWGWMLFTWSPAPSWVYGSRTRPGGVFGSFGFPLDLQFPHGLTWKKKLYCDLRRKARFDSCCMSLYHRDAESSYFASVTRPGYWSKPCFDYVTERGLLAFIGVTNSCLIDRLSLWLRVHRFGRCPCYMWACEFENCFENYAFWSTIGFPYAYRVRALTVKSVEV